MVVELSIIRHWIRSIKSQFLPCWMTLDWQYTEPFIYLKNKRKKQPNQGHCKMSFSLIKLKDVVNQRKKTCLKKKKKSWQLERIKKHVGNASLYLHPIGLVWFNWSNPTDFFSLILSLFGFQLKETEDENRHTECHKESRKMTVQLGKLDHSTQSFIVSGSV